MWGHGDMQGFDRMLGWIVPAVFTLVIAGAIGMVCLVVLAIRWLWMHT